MSNLLSQASLVMIPSGYKEDVVYSVVPSDGSGDLSFTRASNGTRINSAGLVEVCPWNLVTQSENIGTSPWTTPNVTITSGQTDPNGGSTAFLVVESTDGGSLRQAITQTGQLCYSIVLKYSSGTNKKASLFCTDANQQAGFDLELGTVSYVSGSTATIESLGNGWYKCAMTFTPSTASTLILFPNYESGVGGVFAWHPQTNIGATAKPYFPTTDRLNVPRLTYQNGGGGCPSLLLEKQSTNLVTYSEQLDNAVWGKSYCSITANATTSPDGTQNADKLIEDSSTGIHEVYLNNAFTLTAGVAYTKTIYAKSAERTQISLNFVTGGFGQGASVIADLSAGTLGTVNNVGGVTGSTATIINAGNGWYRISITMTPASTENFYADFSTALNGAINYTGNGTSGVYIYGAQLEASSYPTSYIPTTTSSATRVADACFKTGISSLIGQTEGTIFYDGVRGNETEEMYFFLQKNGSTGINDSIYIIKDGVQIAVRVYVSGFQVNIVGGSYSIDERIKIAFAYSATSSALYVNGVQIGVDSSATIPTCDNLQIGAYTNDANSIYKINKPINQAIVFPTRLTNAELASLTTL